VNPVELVRRDTGAVVAQACSTCGRAYGLTDSFAVRCCDPRCSDCGAPLKYVGNMRCDACRSRFESAREAERKEKATRIPEAEYDGVVYIDALDRYEDIDDLHDALDGHYGDEPWPPHVWACTARKLQLPDVEAIAERATDDSYEDAFDDVLGSIDRDTLQAALDKANADITATEWTPDYSRLVVLDIAPSTAFNPDPAGGA
jgi:hypothetical protein